MFPFKRIIKPTVYDRLSGSESPSQLDDSKDAEHYHDSDSMDEKLTRQDHEAMSFLDRKTASQRPLTSLRELVRNPHTWIVGAGALALFCLMFLVVVLSVCAMIQRAEARGKQQDEEIIQVDFISWWALHRHEYSNERKVRQ